MIDSDIKTGNCGKSASNMLELYTQWNKADESLNSAKKLATSDKTYEIPIR